MKDNISTQVLSDSIFTWLEVRLLFIQNIIFVGCALTLIFILEFNLDFNLHNISLCLTYSSLIS